MSSGPWVDYRGFTRPRILYEKYSFCYILAFFWENNKNSKEVKDH